MALKCCNKICQLIESIPLYDTENQRQRVLVVARCKNPKCGCLKGEFIYWHTTKETFIHEAIPKQKLREIIKQFKNNPHLTYYKEQKKFGTMQNMSWKYQKNGNIYDFNNTFIEKVRTELKQYEQVRQDNIFIDSNSELC